MPELPEVEFAAGVARAAAVGRTIAGVRVLHPSALRALPAADAASLGGDVVTAVDRRGKHQLLTLASGRALHVHFRMTGDWAVGRAVGEVPRHARVVLDFADGTRLALVDPRALAVVTLHATGTDPLPDLGPEANDPAFDAAWLRAALAGRRAPIKPVLLDQRVVAGLGNIYAVEALWEARIDPRRPAARLSAERLTRLVAAVRTVMRRRCASRTGTTATAPPPPTASRSTTARASPAAVAVRASDGSCRRGAVRTSAGGVSGRTGGRSEKREWGMGNGNCSSGTGNREPLRKSGDG